jgi:multisubunit Na+/H+ antiporter MnhG subunit
VVLAAGENGRTGVIGVLVANLDLIVGWCVLDPSVRALVVALVMAVLSPLMAELGEHGGDVPAIPRGGE